MALADHRSVLEDWAAADVAYHEWAITGDLDRLRDSGQYLCGAGRGLAQDEALWDELATRGKDANTGGFFDLLGEREEEFLAWEFELLRHPELGAHLSDAQALELVGSVTDALHAARQAIDAGHEFDIAASVWRLRDWMTTVNERVCRAVEQYGEIAQATVPNPTVHAGLLGWVRRHRKQVGGTGIAIANGVATAFFPPIAVFMVPGSIASGVIAAIG